MSMDEKVLESINTLISSIKSTEQYEEFDACRRKVAQNQDLKGKIERAKEIRKQLEHLSADDHNGDWGDRLEEEYMELTEDTVVNDFMMAELSVCSILQKVLGEVVSSIDIDFR